MMDVKNAILLGCRSTMSILTRTEGGSLHPATTRSNSGKRFLPVMSKANCIVRNIMCRMATMETHRILKNDDTAADTAYGTCCYHGCSERIRYSVNSFMHPIYCKVHLPLIETRLKKAAPYMDVDAIYLITHRETGQKKVTTTQMELP